MRTCTVSDLFAISQRVVNDAGFLVAPGVIAKAGNIQTYRAAEIGLDGDPNRIVKLYRPREEVAKSVPTFEGAPITNDHPPGKWVTADNWKAYAVGDTRGVSMVGDDMQATLTVRDQGAVKDILNGKSGLSNGYRFQFDDSKKATPTGEAVDGWMVDIEGNHTAIVSKGRGGPDCRVADENPENKESDNMSTRRVIVDGLPLDLEEVAAVTVEKQQSKIVKLAADAETALKLATDTETVSKDLEAKLAEATGKLTAADAEIAALKAKVPTEAQIEALAEERAVVVADAAVLAPDLKPAGKTVDQIRREAITAASAKNETIKTVADAALGGVAVDKATAEVVRAAFAAARATAKPQTTAADSQTAAALLTAGSGRKASDAEDKPSGYSAYCYNLTHPKKASAA